MIPIHPLAEIMPPMTAQEYADLRDSIRSDGLREPLVLLDGAILDGRHRYRACCELGIEPRTKAFPGGDPVRYVIGANIHRRHLNASQRAIAVAHLATLQRGSCAEKQRAKALEQSQQNPDGESSAPPLSNREAARIAGVDPMTIKDARVVLTKGTEEDIAKVRTGEVGVNKIARRLRKEPNRKVYADSRVDGHRSRAEIAERKNRERVEAQRQNVADYIRLRDALNNLTNLSRPGDIVDIVCKVAKAAPIIDAKIDRALNWLEEFSNEWNAKYRTTSPSLRRDRSGHARHGTRTAGA